MRQIIIVALLAFAVITLWNDTFNPRDDSDPPDGRSGLRPLTDNLTGCQYLKTPGGGITPRLDGRGRQVGCR